ncbi:MAG TPA: NAD(P)H-dependent oxidoreductase [Gemmataceae bacterium]|nr:NAD(P)H-dependent oxidoreductase [Gemmataceae bacterium]
MAKPRILAFAGSARKESYNRKLIQIAVRGARSAGADVTLLELKDYPLPIMDEDLEKEGTPENALKLKKIFVEHDGLLMSCPEYNSSITPLLKNTIDWVSRPAPSEPALVGFTGKAATLMSASPGGLGGLRGLVHVRSILGNIGVVVLPEQIAVSRAFEAFNADGSLKDAKTQAGVEKLGVTLATFLAKVRG